MNFIEYVKQIWKNGPGGGTPWSAARLNHMEDGIKNNNSMISELNKLNTLLISYLNLKSLVSELARSILVVNFNMPTFAVLL